MIFARGRDNMLRTATITVAAGTPIAGYDTANLFNENWALPFRIAENTLDLRIDLGAAAQPGWVILGNSDVTVAARLQGHTDDASWGGATDVDQSFTVPTVSVDGFFSSPHLIPTASKRYWRLSVTSNATPVTIGEVVFAATRRTISSTYHYDDAEQASAFQTVINETPYGAELAYELGPRRESFSGQVIVHATDKTAVLELLQSTRGQARPFWMVPPTNTADAWLVRYAGDAVPTTLFSFGLSKMAFPVREVSRGLPWIAVA